MKYLSVVIFLCCLALLGAGKLTESKAQMFSGKGSAVFDMAMRNLYTGQRARMIIRGMSFGGGASMQRCIQYNFEPLMKCRNFINGRAGPEYPFPPPPPGQLGSFISGSKMNMRGSGRWGGWAITGFFQYSQPNTPFTGRGFSDMWSW